MFCSRPGRSEQLVVVDGGFFTRSHRLFSLELQEGSLEHYEASQFRPLHLGRLDGALRPGRVEDDPHLEVNRVHRPAKRSASSQAAHLPDESGGGSLDAQVGADDGSEGLGARALERLAQLHRAHVVDHVNDAGRAPLLDLGETIGLVVCGRAVRAQNAGRIESVMDPKPYGPRGLPLEGGRRGVRGPRRERFGRFRLDRSHGPHSGGGARRGGEHGGEDESPHAAREEFGHRRSPLVVDDFSMPVPTIF